MIVESPQIISFIANGLYSAYCRDGIDDQGSNFIFDQKLKQTKIGDIFTFGIKHSLIDGTEFDCQCKEDISNQIKDRMIVDLKWRYGELKRSDIGD